MSLNIIFGKQNLSRVVTVVPLEKISEDSQEFDEFPGYAEIDEDVATSDTRDIDQMITDNIVSADITSTEKESEKE